MRNHPWSRFLNALSYECPTYEKAVTYLNNFGVADLVPEELYQSHYIKRSGTEADKELPKQHNFATFFTKYADGARLIFSNRLARERLYAYLLLGVPHDRCAKDISDLLPAKVTDEDIAMFCRYFWCVESVPKSELQTFAQTFEGGPQSLGARTFTEEEAILRHELKLPVNVSDIEMLRRIKDTFYVEILKGFSTPHGMKRATLLIENLTDIMLSLREVEKYSLSEQDMKPLFFPTFEEATAFTSIEDMVKKGEEIIGGETRPAPEIINGSSAPK